MLSYKKFDFALQVFHFGFIVIYLVLILGAVQLISMIVHLCASSRFRHNGLRAVYYGLLLLAIIAFTLIISMDDSDDTIEGLIYYTIGTILIGVYYTIICHVELKKLKPLHGNAGNTNP
jgi:L-asparagine transporter-like permease